MGKVFSYMKILLYQIFFFLFQKLKNRYLFLLSCSAFVILYSPLLFSNPHIVQNQAGIPEYICQVNYQCLDHLNNVLLNKKSGKSIYKYCETTLDNTKLCCADPSQCKEPWGKELAKSLRESSLKKVQNSGGDPLSCELNKLSNLINSLSKTQNRVCNAGLKNCNVGCENKLREVTKTFRKCFSISNRYSIKKALKKMQSHPIVEQACFREMYEVVEKYKKQSVDEKFLFREKLETKDIVNCEEIKDINTKSGLNNFALSMCYQAQTRKQKQNEKKEKIEMTEKETRDTQIEPIPLKAEGTQIGQVPLEAKAGRPFPSAASPSSLDEDNLADETQNAESHSESPTQEISGGKLSKEGQLNELKAIFGESLSSSSSGNRYEGAFNKEVESDSITGNTPSHLTRNPTAKRKTTTAPSQTFAKRVSNRTKILAGRVVKKAKETVNKVKDKIKQRKREKEGHLQITHQLVYQSVAAPQVEPFPIQEPQSNIEFPIFKSYDLVKGKPAGVLIQIQYEFSRHCFQNTNPYECIKQRDFNLKLEVRNQAVETKCVPLKKITKNDWQFNPSLESSNKACAFSTRDFSFEEPVIYKFIELDTTRMESVELDQYIRMDVVTNTGHYHGIFETEFSRSDDQTIMQINTENSHIPFRVNIVEKNKVIPNELSVKPNEESKLSLGNCRNNINLDAPNEFCLNVLELEGLDLAFTRIEGDYNREDKKHDNCHFPDLTPKDLDTPNGYSPVSSDVVTRLAESREVKTFLPSLLPLSKLSSNVLKTKKGSKDFILGNCDNSMIPKEAFDVIPKRSGSSKKQGEVGGENPFSGKYFTYGLLKDIRDLRMERAEWRRTGKYDKLFAVVSKSYILYHKLHKSLELPINREIYGFSLVPEFRETVRGHLKMLTHDDHPWSFLGDVAFIREDQLDKGTLSHELAHLLGQRKDFYNINSQNCRPFQGIPLKGCRGYEIPKSLETWNVKGKVFWNFIADRLSIMDEEQDIEQLWIDRESHQKVFSVAAKISRVIQEKKQEQDRQLGSLPQNSILKKILVAGFYHEEQNDFIVPKVKTLETSLLTPSYSRQLIGNENYLTFQLKDKNQTLDEITRPVYKTHLGFLHQKEHSKNIACKDIPFDFSYLQAAFNIPKHGKLKDLRIVVLDSKQNEIFSSSIPKEE